MVSPGSEVHTDGWKGYNADATGFVEALRLELDFEVAGRRVALPGDLGVVALGERLLVRVEVEGGAHGQMLANRLPRTVAADPQVIEAYLGHGASERMAAGDGGA